MAILRWGRRWDPFETLDRMRREMDRLYGLWEPVGRATGLTSGARDFPPVNMYETADDFVVTAEIPGIKPAEVEVSVVGDTLTLKGRRQADVDYEKVSCHRLERDFGSFARAVTLPAAVNAEKVEATYVNGVLQVKLPKAEETKPRVIKVSE